MNKGDTACASLITSVYHHGTGDLRRQSGCPPTLTMTLVDQGVIEEGMKVANVTAGAVPYTLDIHQVIYFIGPGRITVTI